MSLFEIKNIECSRRDNILFSNVCCNLSAGDLLQIDGVNGSGKSTLLRICAGLTPPNAGDIYWHNVKISRCRYQYQSNMVYIGHANGVKDLLTVKENIEFIRALSNVENAIDVRGVLEQIGLPGTEDYRVGKMSAGQKRRIGLTRLIIDESKLWLLDEPFNALDASGKAIIERLIVEHCHRGGTVVFATHQAMKVEGHDVQHIHLGHNS